MSNNKQTHGFCNIPQKKCTLSYCDENGCIYERRNLVGEPTISNNKQSIKLYTEEDVLNMLRSFHNLEMNVQLCMLKLTPIEIPSDEELKKQFDVDEFDPYDLAYLGGAIRMRNLILGGNK